MSLLGVADGVDAGAAAARARDVGAGVALCKDIVNAPPNRRAAQPERSLSRMKLRPALSSPPPPDSLTPGALAGAARALADETGLACTVLDADECARARPRAERARRAVDLGDAMRS